MKKIKIFISAMLFLGCFNGVNGAVISLQDLNTAMLRSNHDIKILKLKNKFSKEQIVQAKSGHYPRLSSSWIVNEGKESDPISTPEVGGGPSSINSGIPSASPSSSVGGSQGISQDGWSGDLSLSLPVFNRFAVATAVKNSKISKKKENLSLEDGIVEKKAQLMQLILEINNLKAIRKTIHRAERLVRVVKKNKGQSNIALYSKDKQLKNEEFYADLEYQSEKVNLAYGIAIQAFFDLIPEAEKDWPERLPKLKVNFQLDSLNDLKSKLLTRNISLKKLSLDIESFKNVYKQTRWEKPWIPQFFITGTYSKNRDWQGKLEDKESWRTSAMLTFNLFDGFYTEARRAQAHLSYLMSRELDKTTRSKLLINIESQYRQAKMAMARHRFMLSKVKRTKRKIEHIKNVSSSGVSMKTEKSALLLELSKYQWESLDELKKYQQKLLSMAKDTNQLEEVKVHYE